MKPTSYIAPNVLIAKPAGVVIVLSVEQMDVGDVKAVRRNS